MQIPPEYQNHDIVHLEAINIVVALKLWAREWKDSIIEIKCDNMAAVEVIRTGRARDSYLASCARNIWLLTAMYNIRLIVNHIPGHHNVMADLLSRWTSTTSQSQKLASLVPNYVWIHTHPDLMLLNMSV